MTGIGYVRGNSGTSKQASIDTDSQSSRESGISTHTPSEPARKFPTVVVLAVLDENGQMRLEVVETFGKYNETTMAKISWPKKLLRMSGYSLSTTPSRPWISCVQLSAGRYSAYQRTPQYVAGVQLSIGKPRESFIDRLQSFDESIFDRTNTLGALRRCSQAKVPTPRILSANPRTAMLRYFPACITNWIRLRRSIEARKEQDAIQLVGAPSCRSHAYVSIFLCPMHAASSALFPTAYKIADGSQ